MPAKQVPTLPLASQDESLHADLEQAATRKPPAQKRHTLRAHEIATPKVSFAPDVPSAVARRRSRAPGTAPAAMAPFSEASLTPVESEVVPLEGLAAE
jgi:hypothetical protein